MLLQRADFFRTFSGRGVKELLNSFCRVRNRVLVFFSLFFLFFTVPAWTDTSLPRIERLDNRDTIFRQYLQDVEAGRRRVYLSSGSPETIAEYITIYSYVTGADDELLGLAARCNIPYGSIASINRISNPENFTGGVQLLLPSIPGLFIPEIPENDIEMLYASSREGGVPLTINGERFRFIPGADFSPTERVFFLNRGFRFPLPVFRLTSPFGMRINPVTGRQGMHQGVDLAAPAGTAVYAARDGIVSEQGEDPLLGLYVIISHSDNWVSLYGHLSKIETLVNQEVRSGGLVGRVGSTGQSTGPHLHFELRQNGRAQDPGRLLRIFTN